MFFAGVLKVKQKIAGSGSGSISQRHGSANPDQYQNVTDPQQCQDDFSFLVFADQNVCNSEINGKKENIFRQWILETANQAFLYANFILLPSFSVR
jgi:hypothetical protein